MNTQDMILLSARIERLEVLVLAIYEHEYADPLISELKTEHYNSMAGQSQIELFDTRIRRIAEMINGE